MGLNSNFVNLARCVGVSDLTPASPRTSLALSKMTGLSYEDSLFLMRVVTLCGQQRAYFEVLDGTLQRLVTERPSLKAFYLIARSTALSAGMRSSQND